MTLICLLRKGAGRDEENQPNDQQTFSCAHPHFSLYVLTPTLLVPISTYSASLMLIVCNDLVSPVMLSPDFPCGMYLKFPFPSPSNNCPKLASITPILIRMEL